jgi:hypothetical protein
MSGHKADHQSITPTGVEWTIEYDYLRERNPCRPCMLLQYLGKHGEENATVFYVGLTQ